MLQQHQDALAYGLHAIAFLHCTHGLKLMCTLVLAHTHMCPDIDIHLQASLHTVI